jgi:teichuronic acid biosynthesis glycosyltransferase TuaC
MRLLFISNLFPDSREAYRGLDNATILHGLADKKWSVRVLALRPSLPIFRRKSVPRSIDIRLSPRFLPVPYVPRYGSRVNHILYARALRTELERLRGEFDVALTSWIYPDSCAVARVADFPFVSIAQGSDVHQYMLDPVRRKVITSHMPKAAGIITRSADLGRRLAEAGLDSAKIHPVHNGIDLTTFRPPEPGEKAALRQEFGIPKDVPLILFVGNFLPVKNPMIVIEGHRTLRTNMPQAWMALIGGGPMEKEMRASIRQNAKFVGRQPSSEVARWMRAADCLILPSVNEGVPNVILEAFASGLPVVASRVGGIPEVLSEQYGRLIEPTPRLLANGVLEVLSEKIDPAKLAAHGRSFTWEKTIQRYEEILRAATA